MKIIAHRGASMEAPENTISSIQRAIDMNVDFIEFDVHLSKDGIPVVIHDPYIVNEERILKRYVVKDLTFKELREFDRGSWFLPKYEGEQIPSLEGIFDLHFGESGLMVEIKDVSDTYKTDVKIIVELIQEKGYGKKIIIGSLIPAVVEYLTDINCPIHIIGISESETDLLHYLTLKPDIIALRHQLVNHRRIQALHDLGIEVWAWTS